MRGSDRVGARRRIRGGILGALLLAVVGADAAGGYERLSVAGEPANNGIFDPSIEFDPDSGEGWLSYSAVSGPSQPWGPFVETHLAHSQDGGSSWSYVGALSSAYPGQVEIGGVPTAGVWNHEVSSLVHDPGDPGAEWKLFGHRIFRRTAGPPGGDQTLPAFSWITLRSASDPVALAASPEIALMGSGIFPPPPYPTALQINALDPHLQAFFVYSEPGAYSAAGVLYLSLSAIAIAGPEADEIVLLASTDHGASWAYLGSPLTSADGVGLGAVGFEGSAIVEQAGRTLLLVSRKTAAVKHHGALSFEFEDLGAGLLVRSAGLPVVRNAIPLSLDPAVSLGFGGGQADFHEQGAGGILMNQLDLSALPEAFQVFETSLTPLPEPGVAAQLGVGLAALFGLGVRRRRATPSAGAPGRFASHPLCASDSGASCRACVWGTTLLGGSTIDCDLADNAAADDSCS